MVSHSFVKLIQWDSLIVENVILAGIVWFAVYLEQWAYRYSERQKDDKTRKYLTIYLDEDLKRRLRFIDESLQFKDYKPFFTDMWDSIILAGKHSLLPFNIFQNLQRTYSWMKYYNNELDISNKGGRKDEKVLEDLLEDVRKHINGSLSVIQKIK